MKEIILKMKADGKTPKEISSTLGCSVGTVYWHTSQNTRNSILENKRKRRKELRIHVKQNVFGGKCCLCGYNRSLAALDFHHLDKDKKEALIATLLNEGYVSKLETELQKVILVCKNCHCEIHDGLHTSLPQSPYHGEQLN